MQSNILHSPASSLLRFQVLADNPFYKAQMALDVDAPLNQTDQPLHTG
jgi:hypothetical protein